MIRLYLIGLLFLCFYGFGSHAAQLPPSELPPEGSRNMVFISDLHMGVGENKDIRKWYKIEDFRWHGEFENFIDKIDEYGESKVDLVIVGDMLELWQSLYQDCVHDKIDKNLGCTEEEAVQRARIAVSQHAPVFTKLSQFAGKGDNRVTIIPGNHDVALIFKRVQQVVLKAFPSLHSGRIRIADEGYWMSADGKVLAEHGQQIGLDPNRFNSWPTSPFIKKDNVYYLQKTVGENFVQKVFNSVEKKFATIDNLSSEWVGIKYAVDDNTVLENISIVGDLLRFALFQLSFEQAIQVLGENDVPIWDLVRLRKQLKTPKERWVFLIESLPYDHPVRVLMLDNTQKLPDIPSFDNDELNSICNRRWVTNQLNKNANVAQCPDTGKLGAIQELIGDLIYPPAKNKRYRKYLTALRDSLPKTRRPTNNFQYYIYGHTHKTEENYRPFSEQEKWSPYVFNSGAWQRTADERVLCTILKSNNLTLSTTQVEHLPACYPFISGSYDKDGKISMNLFYWVHKTNQVGQILKDCTDLLEIHDDCR